MWLMRSNCMKKQYGLFKFCFDFDLILSHFLFVNEFRIEPSDIRSHLNLGNALLSMNDSIGAERAYQQALKYSESELFEPSSSKTKNLPTIVHNPTISPLYHTVLVRLAELFHNDASRVRDLEQIKTKMITFNSLITNSLELSHLYNVCNSYQ